MLKGLAASDLPKRYSHLEASHVFSHNWGRGWLGYYIIGDTTQIWFVFQDGGAIEIEYQDILAYDDRRHGLLWLIFRAESYLPFVLDPPEGAVVFELPPVLRRLVEE